MNGILILHIGKETTLRGLMIKSIKDNYGQNKQIFTIIKTNERRAGGVKELWKRK